ncbi:MAG: type II secretion system protein [Candidatus Sericytochromatia bacterium]|nr:type II secretion system protein [Candidatus Sericytochromatia bacterium]
MHIRRRQPAGFTVLELAIACVIMGVFMAGAMAMVVRNNQMARQNQAKMNATQAIRAGGDRIQPLLRKADRLLINTAAIPNAVQSIVGTGFFATQTTGVRSVVLRSPVFNPDGSLSGSFSYTSLYAVTGATDRSLLATYCVMRPDGTLDYKRKDEILVHDLVVPRDRDGNQLAFFTYFDETGSQIAGAMSQAAVDSIVRVRLGLAASDNDIAEKQRSQLTSEIRLANSSTRNSVDFIVYNSYGASKVINNLDIVGPTTATLTRVEFGTVAVWTGSTTLTTTKQRLPISTPYPAITGNNTIPATLWFTQTSNYTGNYTAGFVTMTGETLASSFTN